MTTTTQTTEEIARYLDQGIEALNWCRAHLEKRTAVEKLRQLEITLAAVSLAIDQEMEGEPYQAAEALLKADWRFGRRYTFSPDDEGDFIIECG